VAGQRRHDQHHGLALELGPGFGVVGEALEAAQLAKGLVDLHALVDGHLHAVDIDGMMSNSGFS
jgi:hypothetical protein